MSPDCHGRWCELSPAWCLATFENMFCEKPHWAWLRAPTQCCSSVCLCLAQQEGVIWPLSRAGSPVGGRWVGNRQSALVSLIFIVSPGFSWVQIWDVIFLDERQQEWTTYLWYLRDIFVERNRETFVSRDCLGYMSMNINFPPHPRNWITLYIE